MITETQKNRITKLQIDRYFENEYLDVINEYNILNNLDNILNTMEATKQWGLGVFKVLAIASTRYNLCKEQNNKLFISTVNSLHITADKFLECAKDVKDSLFADEQRKQWKINTFDNNTYVKLY